MQSISLAVKIRSSNTDLRTITRTKTSIHCKRPHRLQSLICVLLGVDEFALKLRFSIGDASLLYVPVERFAEIAGRALVQQKKLAGKPTCDTAISHSAALLFCQYEKSCVKRPGESWFEERAAGRRTAIRGIAGHQNQDRNTLISMLRLRLTEARSWISPGVITTEMLMH